MPVRRLNLRFFQVPVVSSVQVHQLLLHFTKFFFFLGNAQVHAFRQLQFFVKGFFLRKNSSSYFCTSALLSLVSFSSSFLFFKDSSLISKSASFLVVSAVLMLHLLFPLALSLALPILASFALLDNFTRNKPCNRCDYNQCCNYSDNNQHRSTSLFSFHCTNQYNILILYSFCFIVKEIYACPISFTLRNYHILLSIALLIISKLKSTSVKICHKLLSFIVIHSAYICLRCSLFNKTNNLIQFHTHHYHCNTHITYTCTIISAENAFLFKLLFYYTPAFDRAF